MGGELVVDIEESSTELGIREQHRRAAVTEDVDDLLGCEVPVDNERVGADLAGREDELEVLPLVVDEGRCDAALGHADLPERARQLVDACAEFAEGRGAAALILERDPAGLAASPLPRAERHPLVGGGRVLLDRLDYR